MEIEEYYMCDRHHNVIVKLDQLKPNLLMEK